MNTVAFELVPPLLEAGTEKAVEEGRNLAEQLRASGLTDRVRHVMIPGMIAEDPDRPVEMKPRMDTLDFWRAIRPELDGVGGLCTQVTAFHAKAELAARLGELRDAGMDGMGTFVGIPRTMADGEGPGVAPTRRAFGVRRRRGGHRGVILIPTREGEQERFAFKCERGATFGMTQLLFSDAVVDFLTEFARRSDHRPEILLSFGFVPDAEERVELIDWLIKDPGNAAVEREQELVASLATSASSRSRTRSSTSTSV